MHWPWCTEHIFRCYAYESTDILTRSRCTNDSTWDSFGPSIGLQLDHGTGDRDSQFLNSLFNLCGDGGRKLHGRLQKRKSDECEPAVTMNIIAVLVVD